VITTKEKREGGIARFKKTILRGGGERVARVLKGKEGGMTLLLWIRRKKRTLPSPEGKEEEKRAALQRKKNDSALLYISLRKRKARW